MELYKMPVYMGMTLERGTGRTKQCVGRDKDCGGWFDRLTIRWEKMKHCRDVSPPNNLIVRDVNNSKNLE
jgi:hypothetical protein